MLALMALASGALLIAMVGWSLVQTSRQDRLRAELEARSAARELAQTLRQSLRTPALLDQVPDETRFLVTGGVVQCDEEVGWAQPIAEAPPDAAVVERLRQAQIAEFVRGDAAAARAAFAELLGPMGPQGDRALPIVVAAAWQAQRAGEGPRVDALLARLDAALTAAPPAATADPAFARVVASTVLLEQATGRAPRDHRTRLLPALAPAIANPTIQRLREFGADTAAIATECARRAARRELLATVREHLPTATISRGPLALGDQLLVWFPGDTVGTGRGALLPRTILTAFRARSAAAAPNGGELVFALPASEAEDVVPGSVWVTATPLPPPPWFARPAAIVIAALLLVLVFAASAFVTMRGLRREALANRARAEFLTGVTHELKTPIAAIRLIADVMTDDQVTPDKQRDYVALLAGETARLTMLIDNVLDLGQRERGERACDLRPGDLVEVLREAVALFAPLARQAGMAIDLCEKRATLPAMFDRGALVQSLLSVFENARKYAAAGRQILVSTDADGDRATIAVRDFGPGVPAAERQRIFERFARGSEHRHGSTPGLGLGLHLAQTIVQQHGGTLACEAPAVGPGACFVFTLPLRPETTP